jgi:integrase
MTITLRTDAEQAKRATLLGGRMARRRFQNGSLFQRGTRRKVWVARWWEEVINPDSTIGRRRRAEVLGTVAEIGSRSRATDVLSKRISPINSGSHRPQSTRCFAEFIALDWSPVVLPSLKYATQKHYRYVLDVHLLPHFGTTRLYDITREQIQSFLAAKFRAGLSWKTVKHIRGVLGRTLSSAEDWGYITQNPALKTQLPRRPLQQRPEVVLTPKRISELMGQLKEPVRSIATLLVLSGLRVGELLALRWKCVDLVTRTLRIAETVYDGHFDTPKTQRSARVIPLSDEACRTLERLQHAHSQAHELVFKTAAGTPLNRQNLLRRHLRPACQRLGLERIGWHSLRHAHATLLDAAGAPLGTVQALLGHSSPEITRGIYIHAIPEDQRKAVANVETLLFGLKRTQVLQRPETSAA